MACLAVSANCLQRRWTLTQSSMEARASLGYAHAAPCPTATCRQDHLRSIGVVQILRRRHHLITTHSRDSMSDRDDDAIAPVEQGCGFETPCDARRGQVDERPDGLFLHF